MRYFQRTTSFRKSNKLKEQPIFGVPLSVAVERSRCHDGVSIPLVVRDCIDHIQEVGLNTEGLYKVSGKSKAQSLRRLYNQREMVNLAEYDLPATTSLLKTYLRELPEPLLTAELLPRFEEVVGAGRLEELKALVDRLPQSNRQLLAWLIKHFDAVVAHEKQNKMSSQVLVATMSPVLQLSAKLLSAILTHCDTLFPDCKLTKYVPPLSCGSPSLPETKEAIMEELRKQESLLGQLHSEMQQGLCSRTREEQLWEVQRIITQLKRKLRVLERSAESAQRSLDEPDCGRGAVEEELNLSLQSVPQPQSQPAATQQQDPAPDRSEPVLVSADSLEIQAVENSRQARMDEMALTLEVEELTSLAQTLQGLIQAEKAEVQLLSSKIRSLGAVPIHSRYPAEMVFDESTQEGREIATLQKQRETLAASLIEEWLACVDLRVQIRLAQVAKG